MDTPVDRLRTVIREVLAGETQTALGLRLGVTQSTISGWLKEDGLDPKASVLEAVARVLGVSGHWLLTGIGDRHTLDAGGDAVRQAGVQDGLRQAEAAVRALRATSAETDGEPAALAKMARRRREAKDTPRPKSKAGATRRRAAGD